MSLILGPECPYCGRDNSEYGNACTSEFCDAAMANRRREDLYLLGELAYRLSNLNQDITERVMALIASVADQGAAGWCPKPRV